MLEINMIHNMNCLDGLKLLDDNSIHCCVTSPPYWGLRDYGLPGTDWPEVTYRPMPGLPEVTVPAWHGCLGLEPTIEMFVGHIVLIFREVRRVLRKDGTLWINFGDSYCTTAPGTKTTPIHIKGLKPETAEARARYRPKNPNGLKPKDLVGQPWRIAFALQADGWYLRNDNIWDKPNAMPESTKDRCTKSHEYIFLLSKSSKYYYDAEAIEEPCVCEGTNNGVGFGHGTDKTVRNRDRVNGHKNLVMPGQKPHTMHIKRSGNLDRKYGADRDRPDSHLGASIPWEGETQNKRTVWTIATKPFKEAHFATFPPKLIEPCILAGCPAGGTVLDPFMGSGTTAMVAKQNERKYIGIEMSSKYIEIAERRIAKGYKPTKAKQRNTSEGQISMFDMAEVNNCT